VWAADYEHPLIVRIVPGRLDGEIAAVFPEDDQPSAGRGPLAIAAGLGSIWVLPAEGTRLVQVDPDSGATRSHELPFALSRICAGPDALFGIEPLGDGRVARIDPDYVRAHREHQLYSALVYSCIRNLPGAAFRG